MIDDPHQDDDEFPPADYVARVTAALPAAVVAIVKWAASKRAATKVAERG